MSGESLKGLERRKSSPGDLGVALDNEVPFPVVILDEEMVHTCSNLMGNVNLYTLLRVN